MLSILFCFSGYCRIENILVAQMAKGEGNGYPLQYSCLENSIGHLPPLRKEGTVLGDT